MVSFSLQLKNLIQYKFNLSLAILFYNYQKKNQHFKKCLKCQNTIVIVSKNVFSQSIILSCLYLNHSFNESSISLLAL